MKLTEKNHGTLGGFASLRTPEVLTSHLIMNHYGTELPQINIGQIQNQEWFCTCDLELTLRSGSDILGCFKTLSILRHIHLEKNQPQHRTRYDNSWEPCPGNQDDPSPQTFLTSFSYKGMTTGNFTNLMVLIFLICNTWDPPRIYNIRKHKNPMNIHEPTTQPPAWECFSFSWLYNVLIFFLHF